MTCPQTPASRLRQIADDCLSGRPIESELASWLGQSLRRFLDRHTASMEEALGLKYPRGGVPWWLEEAIRERDDALRRLAGELFAEMTAAATAKKIHSMAVRYAASSWRFDKDREQPPCEYAGTVKEYLWTAFKSGAAMPIGERQLRNILVH